MKVPVRRKIDMRSLTIVVVATLLVSCGPEATQTGKDKQAAASNGPLGSESRGQAIVTIRDREWRIDGRCFTEGSDLTFMGQGDPMLNIGFNSSGTPSAVGNFSSQHEGFGIGIGNPDVPKPSVSIVGDLSSVSGTFLVLDGSRVDGKIEISCGLSN